jgi:lipopolysaccharide/colanic/teichoic acid biosynthesis glycosyltransferase
VKRKFLLLSIDLFWIALSPFAALFIRDNFAPREASLSAAVDYALVGVIVAVVVLPIAGVNRTLWRYTSLSDLFRLALAVMVTLLLALFTAFALSRLQDIPRSLPVIQWLFLVAAMAGTRIAIRMWREQFTRPLQENAGTPEIQHIVIVGVNQIAELYLRSIAEFAPGRFSVAGILASGVQLKGRLLGSFKVLGIPEDAARVVRELAVHGVSLDRIVVAEPLARLSGRAQEVLFALERSSNVEVDWLTELLGFDSPGAEVNAFGAIETVERPTSVSIIPRTASGSIGGYRYVKRVMDALTAAILILMLAPLVALIAALVAVDVGLPVVFWQKRPGYYGRPFRIYKFRTMHAAHDEEGNRIPDQQRSSKFGELLRRSRLDELPQLYNILVGQMSFVGPRPLLPIDHASGEEHRLVVRPGLTGWAQVNGGRELSPEDKCALDLWYIKNISLALDFRIALRTCAVVIAGERVEREAILAARESIPPLERGQVEDISRWRRIVSDGENRAAAVSTG